MAKPVCFAISSFDLLQKSKTYPRTSVKTLAGVLLKLSQVESNIIFLRQQIASGSGVSGVVGERYKKQTTNQFVFDCLLF
jgi:hypothetical protein